MSKSDKIILDGIFVDFAPVSYPNGQPYDKYDWDWDSERWVLSDKWIRLERKNKIKKICANKLK